MGHGLVRVSYGPWVMDGTTLYNPWVMGLQECRMTHGSWAGESVVWPMGHGWYNIYDPWVVQRYTTLYGPWVMGKKSLNGVPELLSLLESLLANLRDASHFHLTTLGTRGGGPGRYTAGTSQGRGQCTRQKPTWYIANIFKIYQANFIAMFPVQEMLSTFTVFPVMWLQCPDWVIHGYTTNFPKESTHDVPK